MEPTNYYNTTQVDYFSALPVDIMGNILDQLNRQTGTKEVVNKADISMVLKYARNLACTSKEVAKKLAEHNIMQVFLDSLSKRFGHSAAHFAALLNTAGSRQWLWRYIKDNGDEEAYLAIQDIYQLAAQVLQEAKESGISFNFKIAQFSLPSDEDQTQSGLFLYDNCGPKYLATPFGNITIFKKGAYSNFADISVLEIFIKQLNARFEGFSRNSLGSIYEISSSNISNKIRRIYSKDLKQINRQELKERRGTSTLIKSYQECSIYKITQINGKPLPDAIWYPSSKYKRSDELIQTIWKMLERKHAQGVPQTEVIKKKDIEKSIEFRPLFKDLSEITLWAINLVKQLADQPLFLGQSYRNISSKLLVLESYSKASFIELLNQTSQTFLKEETHWNISSFGCGTYRFYLNQEGIGEGLQLFVDNDKQCDLDTLSQAYQSVLDNIGLNWERKLLRDYPHILHTQSEEEYILYVKEKRLFARENNLVTALVQQLGISDFISCSDSWKEKFYGNNKPVYLWIKKDKLEEVITLLKLPKSCLTYTPNNQN